MGVFLFIGLIVTIVIIAGCVILFNGGAKPDYDELPDEPYTIVDAFEFGRKYVGLLDKELQSELIKKMASPQHTIAIPNRKLEELNKKLNAQKVKDVQFAHCVELNNTGIKLEQNNCIDEAITTYEECLSYAPAMCHPYDRLMILYRKRKDYDNEIKVIDMALEVLCARYPQLIDKYTQRREKSMQLKSKSTN